MKKIVLASSSSQRQLLMQKLGIDFIVDPANFDEASIVVGNPKRLAQALALAKAQSVARRHYGALIIGADTIVNLDHEVFGKPRDAEHAKEILKKLNGREHAVITGVAIYDADTHKFLTDAVETKVHFRPLSDLEIEAYVKSGEPFGKAGGYAIQGLASLFVEKIDGDYFNVVGLPVGVLYKRLCELGIERKLY